jgi:hypothetical protein
VAYLYSQPGGKHSQSLRNVGLQSMVLLLSNIQRFF